MLVNNVPTKRTNHLKFYTVSLFKKLKYFSKSAEKRFVIVTL